MRRITQTEAGKRDCKSCIDSMKFKDLSRNMQMAMNADLQVMYKQRRKGEQTDDTKKGLFCKHVKCAHGEV